MSARQYVRTPGPARQATHNPHARHDAHLRRLGAARRALLWSYARDIAAWASLIALAAVLGLMVAGWALQP